jgi:hypothetical protein
MPLEFATAKQRAGETDPLLKLLPIIDPCVVKPPEGFAVALTEEGKRAPLMQLADGPEEGDVWSELPPHYWGVVGQPKPAATVLASQDGQALIAWHPYGQGRVLFVGIDSTWRWRYKVGDKYHHRFWGQLARWAAADKLLEGGTSQVRYGTPRATYQTGQEIDVMMRLSDEIPVELPKGPARARIVRQGAKNDTVAVVKELADKSGGKVYAPEDASQLINLLTRQDRTRVEGTEHHLWEWWPTLALVLLLLTAEWVIRKWVGLP